MIETISPDLVDAGKRASDAVNLHVTFGKWDDLKNKWMAFKLSDGSHDGVLYDSATDAAKHQFNEQQCVYVAFRGLGPAGAKPQEMAKLINFWRQAYDSGMRFVDPDNRMTMPMMTAAQNDYQQGLIQNHSLLQLAKEFGIDHRG